MPFIMQQMRRVCSEFADGTSGFLPHLDAVEDAAEKAPFASAERAFEDEAEFNVAFGERHMEQYGDIVIAEAPFRPSEILWTLNRSRYDQAVEGWRLEGQENGEGPEAE